MKNINALPAFLFDNDKEQEVYSQLEEISKVVIMHPPLVAAITGLKHCIKGSAVAKEPLGCMLTAEGGMGKTTASLIFRKQLKPATIIEDGCEIDTVPAFYISLKSKNTVDFLVTEMLRMLNDPRPEYGNYLEKSGRASELLKRCRTLVVFIDELHDLIGLRGKKADSRVQFLGFLKQLSNQGGPVICLMGTSEIRDIFIGDTQMSRRFKYRFELPPLTPGTQSKPGYLPGFLLCVCRDILEKTPITAFPPLHEHKLNLKMYAATAGNLCFTMTLIKEAVRLALINGRTSVHTDDFKNVWDMGLLNAVSIMKMNPFAASDIQVANAFKGAV